MSRSPLLALVLVVVPLAWTVRADGPPFERRWVWIMANLLVDKEADRVIGLIERAGKAGYNGAVLSDTKFNILGSMPERYAQNVARVKAAAEKAKVEIIPSVFPIGYSNALLANDPNLAEGMAVERAPFVVKTREARLVPDAATKLVNGGLEELRGDKFAGFGYQDEPGKVTVADREVKHGGDVSCRMQDLATSPVSRLIQTIKVRPHACYRLACWAKTRDLNPTGAFRVLAIGASGRTLSFQEGGLEPTRDWTHVDVVFNSQDESQINVYVGMWGAKSGTLWVDDLTFEEVSLVNVLRREGCPLVVASEDGKTTFAEGRDFEPVVDPKLGQVPYAGEFSFDHAGPSLRIKAGSRIREGDKLRVSWYHPCLVLQGSTSCCLSEPKVYDVLRDQARRIEALLPARTYRLHATRRAARRELVQGVPHQEDDGRAVARRECEEVYGDPQGGQPEGDRPRLERHVRPDPQRREGAVLPREREPRGLVGGAREVGGDRQLERRQGAGEPGVLRRARTPAGHRGLLRRRRQLRHLGRRADGDRGGGRVHVHDVGVAVRGPGEGTGG